MIEDNKELENILNEHKRIFAIVKGKNLNEPGGFKNILLEMPSIKSKMIFSRDNFLKTVS